MQDVQTALSNPDFWNKPHSGGEIGLVIGAVVGFALSFYVVPVKKHQHENLLFVIARTALVWLPCMLVGFIAGQLVGIWLGR